MKTIKVTHIDTGGHGYMSVSKKDFLLVCSPEQISGYSGHNLTRIYLEEDQDASLFMNEAEKKGIAVVVKSGYNLKFNCTHNYSPALFAFVPEIGATVQLKDGLLYTITAITDSKIIVTGNNKKYGISKDNVFKYIDPIEKEEPVDMDKVLLWASQQLLVISEDKRNQLLAMSKEEFHNQAIAGYKSYQLINA